MSNGGPTLDYSPPASPPGRRLGPTVAWVVALACTAPVVLCAVLSFELFRASDLDRKMIDASARGQAAEAKTAGDPRFAAVRFWPSSRDGGVLLAQGTVATAADLAALRQIVSATGPAAGVKWDVSVGPLPTTAPARGGGP